jgi:hypothetical protein
MLLESQTFHQRDRDRLRAALTLDRDPLAQSSHTVSV